MISPSQVEKRKRKEIAKALKAVGIVAGGTEVLLGALGGMGGLTFFFGQEFAFETLGWSTEDEGELVTGELSSAAVASLMIFGYACSLGPSVAHNLRGMIRNIYQDPLSKASLLIEEDEPVDLVRDEFKPDPKQLREWRFILGSGIVALVVIGAGATQGVLSIGDALQNHGQLTPGRYKAILSSAIISGIDLLLAFTSFSIPRLHSNVMNIYQNNRHRLITTLTLEFLIKDSICHFIDLFRAKEYTAPELTPGERGEQLRLRWDDKDWYEQWLKAKEENRGYFNVMSRVVVDYSRKPIAFGATLGFAFFKFYAVDELLRGRLDWNAYVVDTLDMISFIALNNLTGLTTGIAIYEKLGAWATRPDVTIPSDPRAFGPGRKFGWALSVFLAAFMSIGVYMGAKKMLVNFPIFDDAVGIFSGLCRMIDYLCFTAPALVDTCGLQPFKPYEKAAEDEQMDDLEAGRSEGHPGLTRANSSSNLLANTYAQYGLFADTDRDTVQAGTGRARSYSLS